MKREFNDFDVNIAFRWFEKLYNIKSPLLCNCSEGFVESMFSVVLQKPAKAKVLRSVLRGDKSCVYEIRY